jgi:hypothetical protein
MNTADFIRMNIKKKTCNFIGCDRPRKKGHTMCGKHASGGTTIAHLKALLRATGGHRG